MYNQLDSIQSRQNPTISTKLLPSIFKLRVQILIKFPKGVGTRKILFHQTGSLSLASFSFLLKTSDGMKTFRPEDRARQGSSSIINRDNLKLRILSLLKNYFKYFKKVKKIDLHTLVAYYKGSLNLTKEKKTRP